MKKHFFSFFFFLFLFCGCSQRLFPLNLDASKVDISLEMISRVNQSGSQVSLHEIKTKLTNCEKVQFLSFVENITKSPSSFSLFRVTYTAQGESVFCLKMIFKKSGRVILFHFDSDGKMLGSRIESYKLPICQQIGLECFILNLAEKTWNTQ